MDKTNSPAGTLTRSIMGKKELEIMISKNFKQRDHKQKQETLLDFLGQMYPLIKLTK